MYYTERDITRGLPKWLVKAREESAKLYWSDPVKWKENLDKVTKEFLDGVVH